MFDIGFSFFRDEIDGRNDAKKAAIKFAENRMAGFSE